ncbi:MAG: YkgJ family cysteine cluster protein [Spirochaetaceae bacterium]|nr:YkgJ family cysteine cluster protein [Spirochaetaceae bacterium]
MAEPFYAQGLRFSCKECSHCCRHEPGYVYLSEKDLTNLCQWFNLDRQDFIKKYCRWVSYYDGTEVLCLQEKENYDCILWQECCTAYEARPIQCSTYPFWSYIVESKESWQKEAMECPGINCGSLCKAEQIEKCLLDSKNSVPIKRK